MVVDKGLSNYLPKKAQRVLVTLFPLDAVALPHISRRAVGTKPSLKQ
jgi:hypothetical protein